MTERQRRPITEAKIRQRALISRERLAAAENTTDLDKDIYRHPRLTKPQEKILVRQMHTDTTDIAALLENPAFMQEINPDERMKWAYLFGTSDNM